MSPSGLSLSLSDGLYVVPVPASVSLFCWLGDAALLPAAILTGECTSFILIFLLRLPSLSTSPLFTHQFFPFLLFLSLHPVLYHPLFPFMSYSFSLVNLKSFLFLLPIPTFLLLSLCHLSSFSSVWKIHILIRSSSLLLCFVVNWCDRIPWCTLMIFFPHSAVGFHEKLFLFQSSTSFLFKQLYWYYFYLFVFHATVIGCIYSSNKVATLYLKGCATMSLSWQLDINCDNIACHNVTWQA